MKRSLFDEKVCVFFLCSQSVDAAPPLRAHETEAHEQRPVQEHALRVPPALQPNHVPQHRAH